MDTNTSTTLKDMPDAALIRAMHTALDQWRDNTLRALDYAAHDAARRVEAQRTVGAQS